MTTERFYCYWCMSTINRLKLCKNPSCRRVVISGTDYCCTQCGAAHEGRYEIHDHSAGCDERWRARRKQWIASGYSPLFIAPEPEGEEENRG